MKTTTTTMITQPIWTLPFVIALTIPAIAPAATHRSTPLISSAASDSQDGWP